MTWIEELTSKPVAQRSDIQCRHIRRSGAEILLSRGEEFDQNVCGQVNGAIFQLQLYVTRDQWDVILF